MNKRKLNAVFKKVKEACGFDYAVTNADEYGDCRTCVDSELAFEFGIDSKGIWAKHWLRGMNKGGSWSSLDNVYIAHDITKEQAEIMIKTFEENGYDIQPKEYDPSKCFLISEIKEK